MLFSVGDIVKFKSDYSLNGTWEPYRHAPLKVTQAGNTDFNGRPYAVAPNNGDLSPGFVEEWAIELWSPNLTPEELEIFYREALDA